MAVDIYRACEEAEVHITIQEFKDLIDAFGGPLCIQLFYSELYVLVRIWDVLPKSTTYVRFQIPCSALVCLSEVCKIANLEVRQYFGDGGFFRPEHPKI